MFSQKYKKKKYEYVNTVSDEHAEESYDTRKYPDLKIDGKLFPTWILHNFKKLKLPEVLRSDTDPCDASKRGTGKKLRLYQLFVVKYLNYESPHRNILLYHGLGSGKTATAINVYNMLFNYTPGWNVFILIRAALKNDPWMQEINDWLMTLEDNDLRFKNIKFVHYDSPFADRDFSNAVKDSDSSQKNIFMIDEVHNFIKNVLSNMSSTSGRRALNIYNFIKQDVIENDSTRVIAMSGTPAVNVPFELSILFNMLRPGCLPDQPNKFNQKYISASSGTLNPATKNKFMRHIMGLVSYYIGSTPDTHATSEISYIDIPMEKYHYDVYKYYEDLENLIEKKKKAKRGGSSGSEMYRSYTRQACNFVFPPISQKVTGENRPRPNKFRISEKEALMIDIHGEDAVKLKAEKYGDRFMNVTSYVNALNTYTTEFKNWLTKKNETDIKNGHTIFQDVEKFISLGGKFKKFWRDKSIKKSTLAEGMYMCSPKFVYMIFNILKSKGSDVVYTNYVKMEGIEIFKIYLKYFNFEPWKEGVIPEKNKYYYGEFHGGITNKDDRQRTKLAFNSIENINGKIIKVILFSPAGTEGISLMNVRQMHITEPYWNEVRIRQMIGRAIRQCSHKDLPLNERHVIIYRYKMSRGDHDFHQTNIISHDGANDMIMEDENKPIISTNVSALVTTDQFIENLAKSKDNLIQSFYLALKEIAVDCELNRAHNMMNTEYKCFKFDENTMFDKHVGPAYKEDDYEDDKIESGSYSANSIAKKIKVLEIKAVKIIGKKGEENIYSSPEKYWFYDKSKVVYDYDLDYPIGKIALDENDLPVKLDKDTYVIDRMIPMTNKTPLYNI
jgi:superfamily II DNA or RNA helicase